MNSRKLKSHLKYLVPEIRLALIKETNTKPHAVLSPDNLAPLVEPLKYYADEHFVAFHLDAKNQVIGYQIVSHGTLSAIIPS